MSVTKTEVLRLYKNLLLYSKSLKFTEISYYKQRITSEFKKNKELEKPEDIAFAFKKGEALLQRGSIV